MHGQFPHDLGEKLVDNEQSYRWLKFGDIKVETECKIVAAQDQAISTNFNIIHVLCSKTYLTKTTLANFTLFIHSFCSLSYRQVRSLFQSEISKRCDLVLPLSISSIFSFPKVIQQLLTSSPSSSRHFYPSF
jgi:hypothetical protein